MNVLIYGAGALGQAVGGLLADGCRRVVLVTRSRWAQILRVHGLAVTGVFGNHSIAPGGLDVREDLSGLSADDRFDYVLVTTKSYDTAAAADDLKRIDDGRFVVVSLQNGYGNVEALSAAFGADRVLGGRVITGFVIHTPGAVDITVHADSITVGRWDGQASPAAEHLAAVMSAGGLPARASTSVQAELWAKILYNCALNPLGAILGVTYGRLAEDEGTRDVMDQIIAEAYAMLDATGRPRLHATADAFARAFYGQMVPPTSAHAPSMLQDLRAGKRTEIDALNGAMVRLAQQAGLDAPVNATVTRMVKFLETRSG